MKKIASTITTLSVALLLLLFNSCNTSKNTPNVRWWKGFKTRYNTYYNGHEAYLEGVREKSQKNKDNYVNVLPLLIAGNEDSRDLGRSNFETAITKCEKAIQLYSIHNKPVFKRGHRLTEKEKALRNQTEFNPFMQNVWMLMGLSQLEKSDFIEAASTFAYTARIYRTQPEICNQARAMQAVCYAELGWYYDAEQLLDKIRRDGIPKHSKRYYNLAMADLQLRQRNWEQALPYLIKEVKSMNHGIVKARGYFLLSQVYKKLNKKKEAYQALSKCKRQSPPYEMRFNADISQTEVMVGKSNKSKISHLKRMAANPNNKDYLDQVYYAIGNVYLAQPDTAHAIESYENGGRLSKRNSLPKGLLMVNLGDIYWNQEKFSDALRCYKQATSIIKYEDERFPYLRKRAKVLEELAPYTDIIHHEDSIQALTRMSEAERNAIIDKAIELERKRQKEEEKRQADSIAKARAQNGGSVSAAQANQQDTKSNATANSDSKKNWYFYDQNTVNQGMDLFKKAWGNRPNEDNWRLINKSTTSTTENSNAPSKEKRNVDDDGRELAKVEQQLSDSARKANKRRRKELVDPNDSTSKLSRAYYISQLPFRPDQLKASNDKLKNALYLAGLVEKDQLGNYNLAHKTLMRLYNNFPDFLPMDHLLYHLFLMELRWGPAGSAETYRQRLTAEFPESPYTLLINDPDFEVKAKYGVHMEDSTYARAYEAFRANDYATLEQACHDSDNKYPQGANRAKFLFLEAMTALRKGDVRTFSTRLDSVRNHKEDPISDIADNLLGNLKKGRTPIGGNFDMSDLWESRMSLMDEAESKVLNDTLTTNRQENFIFFLAYQPDSVDEGKLLYQLSRFNFTQFAVRNFEIHIIQEPTGSQMMVRLFSNFDEAHRYADELAHDSAFKAISSGTRPIIISEHNLKLVGTKYTWQDYIKFYQRHFIPTRVRKELNLDLDPGKFIWDEFEEVPPKEQPDKEDNEPLKVEDGVEWY
ncbi:MAG: tetratricopeptide repeat protein [Bacteroidaceae bacterium]|nr:tetratricopeptide repeat protein [Bacteroidaceae bacterium]